MTQQNESSALFSIKGLMELEEERVNQERRARDLAEQAALRAKRDAEDRAREQEEARLAADEEARRREEQRVREAQARLDAIRHAEVERARLDAENHARMETLARQQAFEKEIHALDQDKSKKRLKVAVGVTVGALVVIASAAAIVVHDANVKQQALTAQLNDLNDQIAASDKKVKDLKDELARASSDAERNRINAEIAQAEADRKRAEDVIDEQKKKGNAPHVRSAPVVGQHVVQCHIITDGTKVASCKDGDGLCVCE
jgi:colicin import membrane protein